MRRLVVLLSMVVLFFSAYYGCIFKTGGSYSGPARQEDSLEENSRDEETVDDSEAVESSDDEDAESEEDDDEAADSGDTASEDDDGEGGDGLEASRQMVRTLIDMRQNAAELEAVMEEDDGFYSWDGMYDIGMGVLVGREEAIRYYRTSADRGDANSQFNLGLIYYQREAYGVAASWFRGAAEYGYAKAQYNLAVMLFTGTGVDRDKKEAVKWFRQAALQGHGAAQYRLGDIYLNGRGVFRDYVKSYIWTGFAVLQGGDGAEENLRALLKKMNPEQIETAQRKADALRVRYHLLSRYQTMIRARF